MALPTINACGYGLAYEDNPGVNGSGWAKMFLDITNNPEAVYVTVYNKNTPDLTPDYQRNNIWEQGARPANTLGNNGKVPSAMEVDLFPMADGKKPESYTNYSKLEASSIAYDKDLPSMTHSTYTEDELKASGIAAGLIRLSVGLENYEDIIADLKQALDTL